MSTVTERRFGTNLLNLPNDSPIKAGKTPKKSTKGVVTHEKENLTKVKSSKSTPSSSSVPKPQPLLQTLNTPQKYQTIQVDDEIIITTPIKSNNCRYERDFLLGFQSMCIQPLEGLIPEVLPGFIQHNIDSNYSTPVKNYRTPSSRTNTDRRSSLLEDLPAVCTPHHGIIFNLSPSKQVEMDYPSSPSRVASTPIEHNERVADLMRTPSSVKTKLFSTPSTPATAPSTPLSATNISLEWRPKKVKRTKPRETDPKRIAARQKQIDIGMNTVGYKRFCEQVPVESRRKDHPRIPDVLQICSKRSWDGQVRKWRRQLHDYDPAEMAGQNREDFDGEEHDIVAADDTLSDDEDDEDLSDEEINNTTQILV